MDYLESTKEVRTWRRSPRFVGMNPLPGEGTPSVAFDLADCVDLGDRVISSAARGGAAVVFVPYQPGATFDRYDPTTGEQVEGSFTHDEYFAMNFSLFMSAAKAQDAAAEAPPDPVP